MNKRTIPLTKQKQAERKCVTITITNGMHMNHRGAKPMVRDTHVM